MCQDTSRLISTCCQSSMARGEYASLLDRHLRHSLLNEAEYGAKRVESMQEPNNLLFKTLEAHCRPDLSNARQSSCLTVLSPCLPRHYIRPLLLQLSTTALNACQQCKKYFEVTVPLHVSVWWICLAILIVCRIHRVLLIIAMVPCVRLTAIIRCRTCGCSRGHASTHRNRGSCS